jgi:hypothetical protein
MAKYIASPTSEELKQFNFLLDETVAVLNSKYRHKDVTISWDAFERVTCDALKEVQKRHPKQLFASWKIDLIGGAKFPDIAISIRENINFGVEVKTTKSNNWKTLGGSIMESTRVKDVHEISVIFAKALPNFEVMHRPFQECVSDVAVTHSPRYVIDFSINSNDSIFRKIGVNYIDVWSSKNPYDFFKNYFKNKAARERNGLWFVDEGGARNVEDIPKLQIQFYEDLPKVKKCFIKARAMVLFPEIFKETAEYKQVALWLANMGILNTSLRDIFSAGSNVNVRGYTVPSKFKRLDENIEIIKSVFDNLPDRDLMIEIYGTNRRNQFINNWKTKMLSESPECYHSCLKLIFHEIT